MPRIAVIENNIIATNTIRRALMLALRDAGFEVCVFSMGSAEGLAKAKAEGLGVVDVGGVTANPVAAAQYLWGLRRALVAFAPQACLTFTIRPAVLGNLVTRQLGVPTISNITGIGPLFEREELAYVAARQLYRVALQKTARVVFQNRDDLEVFVGKGFVRAAQVMQVPGSGVDTMHYAPLPKPDGPFRFLLIARLLRDKGVGEYVEAARCLRAEGLPVVCQLAGPLWLQNLKANTISREELAAWQAEGTIEYLGELDDVRPAIAAADAVVLPSYREGTSNVLLEASSMARPCIATRVTGCKEIVDDEKTGYLCKVRDSRELAAAMRRMWELPRETRVAMGQAGRRKVAREFEKRLVVDAYLTALAQVLRG